MPSLGIASRPGGCTGYASSPAQGVTPVSDVFPTDVKFHRLEIRLQAIQLSPYHAGPPTRRSIRLDAAADFLACSCPLNLSAPGKPSDPRNLPPSSSPLRGGYNKAPRGAQALLDRPPRPGDPNQLPQRGASRSGAAVERQLADGFALGGLDLVAHQQP